MVASFLKDKIHPGADLSFVSAYFTIYAYEALKEQLDQVARLRFLFGEPSFVQEIDPEHRQRKSFRIENDVLKLTNKLEQKRIARECAAWISAKVDVRTVIREGFLHGKMYHIANQGVEEAILGNSNFTVHGLGLAANGNNIELNLEVDSNRDRRDLKAWFDELWHDETLVCDDGNVRFGFAQSKQILEIYRLLSAGRSTPYKRLCQLFDQETDNGSKMDKYSDLLTRSLGSIVHTFKRRAAATLQSGRGGMLVPQSQQASEESEFELITWLVVKSP